MPQVTAADTTASTSSSLLQYDFKYVDGDSSYTRFSSSPAPDSPDVLFKASISGISAQPIAVNGYVLVKAGGAVKAIDPFDGHVVWSSPSIAASGSLVYIDSGHLMVGSGTEKAMCINPTNGQIVWNSTQLTIGNTSQTNFLNVGTTAGAFNCYSPEEKMYYSLSENIMWANFTNDVTQIRLMAWDFANPDAPKFAWSVPIETIAVDSSVWYGGGLVYTGETTGFIKAFNARTGALAWSTAATGLRGYAGSYYMGRVLHGGQDNSFYCLNATTGEVLWVFNPQTFWGFWGAGTACAYGLVYEPNTDGGFYAINVTSGELAWRYNGPGHSYPGYPVVADGKVYMATGSGNARNQNTGEYATDEFACLNATTGELIWSLPVTNMMHDGPIAAYGNVYFIAALGNGVPPPYPRSLYQLWCVSSTPKDWTNFRGDANQTASGSGPGTLSLEWKFTTGAGVLSSPTIVNGVVYVGSQDKNVYALNAYTGAKLWNYSVTFPIRSSMAVANGKVYTGADDGNIYCLDATSGTLVWKTPAGGIVYNNIGLDMVYLRSSPIVLNGKVYVGSLDGKLYCLDANSGTVSWAFQSNGPIMDTASVIANDGIYFTAATPPVSGRDGYGSFTLGNSNFTLYKIDFTGNVVWQLGIPRLALTLNNQVRSIVPASPTVAGGRLWIPDDVANIYCLNTTTGAQIYKITITAGGTGREYPTVASVLYANGKIYAPDYFALSCWTADNGTKLWSTWLGREIYSSPCYSDGKIYIGNDEGTFRVLSETNGTTLSYYHPGTNIWSSPALYDGKLYWAGQDFNVYCFGEADRSSLTDYYPTGTSAWTTYYGTAAPVTTTPTPSLSPSPSSTTTPTQTQTPTTTPTASEQPTQTATISPTETEAPQTCTPTEAPQSSTVSAEPTSTPVTENSTNDYLYVVIVVVVIAVVAIAILAIMRRKK
jgi:outer membrane protein assembly factor BamB